MVEKKGGRGGKRKGAGRKSKWLPGRRLYSNGEILVAKEI